MSGGLPLLVTRPEPGCAATVERALALGLDARTLPLFAARALDWTVPDAHDHDALLLTSAQAARLGGAGLAALAALPVYAVGEATAAAARDAGLGVAAVGDRDAQALLDGMASLGRRRVLWLCGRDRSAFATGLTVTAVPVYVVDPVDPPAGWRDSIAGPAVVLAHSARIAARVADLAGTAVKHLTLLAISAAAADAAGEGWAEKAVSPRPDDAAMLAEAVRLCHKGCQ